MQNLTSEKSRRVQLVALLTTMFLAFPVMGQEAPTSLSLEQAITLGLKRSEDVQIASSELERADAMIREAWAAALPQVGANAGVTHYLEAPVIQMPGPNGSVNEIPIKQDYEVTMGLQVNQVLWAFGRVGKALDLAKIARTMTEYGLEAAYRDLRYNVILAYYEIQTAKELLKAAEESLANAQANKRSLEARFQGGRVPRYDNIRMASDIATRRPNVVDAQKRVDLAYLQFNLLLNLPVDLRPQLTTPMDTKFESYSLNALMDQANAKDINLKSTKAAVEVAEAQLKLEKSQRLPIFAATGNVSRVGTGESVNIDQDNYSNTVGVGVVLTIPIWEGGAHSARQRQAAVDVQQAELRLAKYRQDLRSQLETALQSYRADVERYKLAEEALEIVRESYLLTRTRFTSGGATQTDLNQAEQQLTGAKIQLKTTLLNIHQAKAQMQRIVEEVGEL